jgi:Flp pilus assembly pilin Flp
MLTTALRIARKLKEWQEGATMIEYALVGVLIAVVCVLAVTQVGANTQALFQRAVDTWP